MKTLIIFRCYPHKANPTVVRLVISTIYRFLYMWLQGGPHRTTAQSTKGTATSRKGSEQKPSRSKSIADRLSRVGYTFMLVS